MRTFNSCQLCYLYVFHFFKASCQGGGSALGISESLKTIPNSAITASTQYSINHASYLGRLNGPKAWSAK